MTQYTPGPWKMGINSTGEEAIIGPNGQVVADASWTGGSGCELTIYNEADARLIAAVPDLLGALKNIVTQYNAVHGIGDMEMQSAIDFAHKMIVKATGEK